MVWRRPSSARQRNVSRCRRITNCSSACPTCQSAAAVRAASGRHRRPRSKQADSCIGWLAIGLSLTEYTQRKDEKPVQRPSGPPRRSRNEAPLPRRSLWGLRRMAEVPPERKRSLGRPQLEAPSKRSVAEPGTKSAPPARDEVSTGRLRNTCAKGASRKEEELPRTTERRCRRLRTGAVPGTFQVKASSHRSAPRDAPWGLAADRLAPSAQFAPEGLSGGAARG